VSYIEGNKWNRNAYLKWEKAVKYMEKFACEYRMLLTAVLG
jgi:hypothetical protein